jgi:hypothetical protein
MVHPFILDTVGKIIKASVRKSIQKGFFEEKLM